MNILYNEKTIASSSPQQHSAATAVKTRWRRRARHKSTKKKKERKVSLFNVNFLFTSEQQWKKKAAVSEYSSSFIKYLCTKLCVQEDRLTLATRRLHSLAVEKLIVWLRIWDFSETWNLHVLYVNIVNFVFWFPTAAACIQHLKLVSAKNEAGKKKMKLRAAENSHSLLVFYSLHSLTLASRNC